MAKQEQKQQERDNKAMSALAVKAHKQLRPLCDRFATADKKVFKNYELLPENIVKSFHSTRDAMKDLLAETTKVLGKIGSGELVGVEDLSIQDEKTFNADVKAAKDLLQDLNLHVAKANPPKPKPKKGSKHPKAEQ